MEVTQVSMKTDSASWLRFGAVAVLLLATATFLRTRARAEVLPSRQSVDSFPRELGDWQDVRDETLSPDTKEILGDGDFLSRLYGRRNDEPVIDFFLAYFPSQRTGSTMHSPQHCLPGSGWRPTQHRYIQLASPDGNKPVNLYVISKGLDREVVLYWYQAHGRVVASEYWAKIYLVSDAFSMNRTDGSLVRVITPVTGNETLDDAIGRARSFAEETQKVLDSFVPR